MKKIFYFTAAVAFLAACSTPATKKVVVMASGKITPNGDVVQFEPGTQHNEATLTITGDKITVKSGNDSKEYPVPETGSWLLNLQKDTLIGSVQNYGGEATREGNITQELLMERMDSLKQLIQGANVTPARKNHFLAPNSLKKITSDDNTIIVGPFRGMPASLSPDSKGNVPEVYKFITVDDARQTLDKLEKMLKQ
ncbi:lipoprotein [Flavihumibacter petaseus]|uniref:Lipoprotein n=1 Tax=Flavihumibacter petaseus NBRC 106054 TaxID=1220578 RepID=A0A0E9MYP3_9BACT|nr:hypothetical protein [Flavihumibacter petaseus]GAO42852.1 hypothetical protein FPE01S_01_18700 [Flavihumibacter petaseus NBRC 106054]